MSAQLESQVCRAQARMRSPRLACFARPEMVLLLGLLGRFASPLSAQPANQTTALLDQVALNAGRVESVFARFAQERHLSLFQEPLRSEGCLCFQKPGRIRWEVTQPYQSILVSDGKGVAQFERANDQWRKLDLGLADAMQSVVAQIGAIMEGRYASQQADYSLSATNTADGPVVTLMPRQPAMRKMMRAIDIYLTPDFRATRRVVLREQDGDFTDIRFSAQMAGPPLPAGTFDLNKPADLDLIRQSLQQHPATAPENPASK
jgi:outer membrane lipoprotein carrier protein